MTNRWVRKRLPTGVAMFAVVLVSTMLFSSGGARASHGTFHEFSPPPGGVYIHWPANPTFMQVTMVDRTQPWPVTTATSNWDKPNAFIDNGIVHYHWWNCTHAVNCAIVYEINDPGAFYLGAAFRDWNLSNGHIKENTFIRVNNYYVAQWVWW